MNDKYPENYFEHFIVSIDMAGVPCNTEGFKKLAEIYLSIEGIDTFAELINEIMTIQEANDWSYFYENVSKFFDLNEMDEDKLKELASVAITFYQINKDR